MVFSNYLRLSTCAEKTRYMAFSRRPKNGNSIQRRRSLKIGVILATPLGLILVHYKVIKTGLEYLPFPVCAFMALFHLKKIKSTTVNDMITLITLIIADDFAEEI